MANSAIHPTPPGLTGVTWRPVTGDDLAALVELAEACHSVDGGLSFMNNPDNLRDRYFPGGPGAGIGAFDAGDRLVACSTAHLAREVKAERVLITGQVRPEWRNRGIGDYLMSWSQAQAQAQFTTAAVGKRLLQITNESLTDPADRLYRAYRFVSVMEETVMRRGLDRPLPKHPLPPGVTITSWQPDLARQFFQAYHASFRERPGFPGWSAAEWIGRMLDDEDAKPEWSLLARIGDTPVGFLTAGTDHPGGFVVQVGVVPGQRMRGLGSALMVESMRRMWADGERVVQLTVNVNNPGAKEAYFRLGFTTVGRRGRYVRES